MELLFGFNAEMTLDLLLYMVGGMIALAVWYTLLGVRYLPNRAVGIVERLWSPAGSIAEGRMMVIDQETGYRAAVLRGGIYFLYWIWRYRLRKAPPTIIPQGKIGCTFARDGEPLKPEQTPDRAAPCNHRPGVICAVDYRPTCIAQSSAACVRTSVRRRRIRQRPWPVEVCWAFSPAV